MGVDEANEWMVKPGHRFKLALALLALLASFSLAAQPSQFRQHAAGESRFLAALPLLAENESEGLDSAVSRIRNRTGGRVLSAETRKQNGEDVHVIRVLTKDGRVQRHKVDATTGRTLKRPGRRRR